MNCFDKILWKLKNYIHYNFKMKLQYKKLKMKKKYLLKVKYIEKDQF
jgi:hypothetical protein